MTAAFLILAALAVAGTAAAMGLRNPIHCILALTAGLTAIAGLYLQLGAQFVGLTQLMVYVGAVAILAVFAIMMTHRPSSTQHETYSLTGPALAATVFAVLAYAIRHTIAPTQPLVEPEPSATVQQIGDALMHRFVLPLEIIGLLLTAALIGAVVIAMDPTKDKSKEPQ